MRRRFITDDKWPGVPFAGAWLFLYVYAEKAEGPGRQASLNIMDTVAWYDDFDRMLHALSLPIGHVLRGVGNNPFMSRIPDMAQECSQAMLRERLKTGAGKPFAWWKYMATPNMYANIDGVMQHFPEYLALSIVLLPVEPHIHGAAIPGMVRKAREHVVPLNYDYAAHAWVPLVRKGSGGRNGHETQTDAA